MSTYAEMRRQYADRIYREHEEAKSKVRDWLVENSAPEDILEALEKCANKPTVVWA